MDTTVMAEPVSSEEARLEELASRLGEEGIYSRLTTPIGMPPSLHVLNPQVPTAEEHVIVDRSWFWWAWAQRISPASDLDGAIACIRRVLGLAA
ncbi:hypothetical protein DPM19_25295 [Actinomadura craniellae]|uniref:Uncharacterized protein n=1 Tax=Actinomadura craniellae TaxID=2231787 RepID=A0A365H0B9_9ACTN|nr:hypothetical protein [Actinomadura craniellae]RAY12458.1 hypothetical protein DPM19_25295 [Actinomadura craniellae]